MEAPQINLEQFPKDLNGEFLPTKEIIDFPLSLDEKMAIQNYEEYAERNNVAGSIADLWTPNFEQENYPELDRIDALNQYLIETSDYCNRLNKAAELRQRHFENFISRRKPEHIGHKYYREGLNEIAQDCSEKYRKWMSEKEKALNTLIKIQNKKEEIRMRTQLNKQLEELEKEMLKIERTPKYLTANYDKPKLQRIIQPKISQNEIKRRRIELERQRIENDKREEKILQEAIAEIEPYNLEIEKRISKQISNADEIIEKLKAFKFFPFVTYYKDHELDNEARNIFFKDFASIKYVGEINEKYLFIVRWFMTLFLFIIKTARTIPYTNLDGREYINEVNALFLNMYNNMMPNNDEAKKMAFKEFITILYKHPEIKINLDLGNDDRIIIGPILATFIWSFDCKKLVSYLKEIMTTLTKEPNSNTDMIVLLTKFVGYVYPISFYLRYWRDLVTLRAPEHKVIAIEYYKERKFDRPPLDIYCLNRAFGFHRTVDDDILEAWNLAYKDFLKNVKQ
jgi:hypothetical protein